MNPATGRCQDSAIAQGEAGGDRGLDLGEVSFQSLDIGKLDDLAPLRGFLPQEGRELLG